MPPESLVVRLLIQLIVVLIVTRVVVAIVKRLGQTDVAGEILAGILLGALAPEQMAMLFHPSTSSVFVALAQTGLIFLMFQIGLEFEMRAELASSRLAIFVVSGVGIVVSFTLGYLTAPWFLRAIAGNDSTFGDWIQVVLCHCHVDHGHSDPWPDFHGAASFAHANGGAHHWRGGD